MLAIAPEVLAQIHAHGEAAYPEEGAGFLLGTGDQDRKVMAILPLRNARDEGARQNRYLIESEDYLRAELEAEKRAMDVIGVFHSHPDHPNRPSDYDREWAQPNFSYVITSIQSGKASGSKSWRLAEDRARFLEEEIRIEQTQ